MNIKQQKSKIGKRTLITYSKANSDNYVSETDPTTATITTITLTGIFNSEKK